MGNRYRFMRYEMDYYVDPTRGVSHYIKNFKLTGKSFSLQLIRGNCYEVLEPDKGCSLYLDELTDLHNHHKDDKNNPKHCSYINQLMQDQPAKMFPITIAKFRCGHYSTGQGQHRICISGMLHKSMPKVKLHHVNQIDCTYCSIPDSHILKHF